MKYLTSLKVEVSNISDQQQEIIKMINDIQNKNSAQAVDSWAHDEVDYFVSNWPISDQDALKDMEDKIKTDLNFRKQVVRSFFINRFFILYLILICYYI